MTVTVDGTGAADVRTNCWIDQEGIDLWVDGMRFGPFNVDWRR
jgi:hypothetical protein